MSPHRTLIVSPCSSRPFLVWTLVIISKTWGKEDELKQLKSELAALDRKITAELAPKHDENDGTENKQEQSTQPQPEVRAETTVKTVNVQTTDPPQQGHKP
ncbi:MAG: hypothetical protein K2N35_08535 [Muribaculaceae bacterium]|nr:hypothetical protein [Muribaculaceae bacterium]